MTGGIKIDIKNGANNSRLFAAIADLTGVEFVTAERGDAKLVLGDMTMSTGPKESSGAVSTLSCPAILAYDEAQPTQSSYVQFANDTSVPWPFRARLVVAHLPVGCVPLVLADGERVLASTDMGPLWTVRMAAGHAHFRSALPLLEIPSQGSFAQVFSGHAFLGNLPLLHLLAQFEATGLGTKHKPRASFMFDDPNLHWPSYGFVNYAHLLNMAELENFHVSFATIPLDSWYTHSRTADRFRGNNKRLSLLVHGNNHTKHELAREKSLQGCAALLQQARGRIENLERNAKLSIDRVMVPPHGACSANMLAALPNAGFAGACVSAGSLMAHNPGAAWIRTLGFKPAENILGCPVLPRWALVGIEESEMLVAAYLGRPLILRGHQGDLRDGIEVLTSKARFINTLGDVQWLGNTALMQSSFQRKIVGRVAYVKAFSNEVLASLPAHVDSLVIVPTCKSEVDEPIFGIDIDGGELRALPLQKIPMRDVKDRTNFRIRRIRLDHPPGTAPARGLDTISVLRRLLTEARDRLMPLTT